MKLNIIRGFLILLLIWTFTVIFGFSNQGAEESAGISGKITDIITSKIKYIQEKDPEQKQKILIRVERVIRKLAHFAIYTIVGILLMSLVYTYNLEEMDKIAISLIAGIIYATSDEIHQHFIPGRAAMFSDVIIDSMGILLGVLLVMLVVKIYNEYIINEKVLKENNK